MANEQNLKNNKCISSKEKIILILADMIKKYGDNVLAKIEKKK